MLPRHPLDVFGKWFPSQNKLYEPMFCFTTETTRIQSSHTFLKSEPTTSHINPTSYQQVDIFLHTSPPNLYNNLTILNILAGYLIEYRTIVFVERHHIWTYTVFQNFSFYITSDFTKRKQRRDVPEQMLQLASNLMFWCGPSCYQILDSTRTSYSKQQNPTPPVELRPSRNAQACINSPLVSNQEPSINCG